MTEMFAFAPTLTSCGAAKILAELAKTGPRKRCSMMRSYLTYQKAKKASTRSDNDRKLIRAARTMGSRARRLLPPLPRFRAVGILSLMAIRTTMGYENAV